MYARMGYEFLHNTFIMYTQEKEYELKNTLKTNNFIILIYCQAI